MKLSEVQVRDKVPTGAPGDNTARLQSATGSGPAQGWTLEYDAGVVTATKHEQRLLIPLSNVAYMRTEPAPVKLAKGAA